MPAMTHEQEEAVNEDRAVRAALAVQYYASISGNMGEPEQELVTDLLTDLRHFCAAQGLDFDCSARLAEMHYEAEIKEEG